MLADAILRLPAANPDSQCSFWSPVSCVVMIVPQIASDTIVSDSGQLVAVSSLQTASRLHIIYKLTVLLSSEEFEMALASDVLTTDC